MEYFPGTDGVKPETYKAFPNSKQLMMEMQRNLKDVLESGNIPEI